MSWSPLETSNGFSTDDRGRVSLREKKQQQWSKEKADQQEWFPFGKPGAGAPLKPTRSTRNSSLNARSNASISSVQLNGVNHDLEQKSATGSLYSGPANGHQLSLPPQSPMVQFQYSPSANGTANISYGYVPSIASQPSYVPYYQAFPGAIAIPVQNAGNGLPLTQLSNQSYQNSGAYYAVPNGYQQHQTLLVQHQPHQQIGNQQFTNHQQQQPTSSYAIVNNGSPSERINGTMNVQVIPQENVVPRGSMTASTLTEPSVANGAKLLNVNYTNNPNYNGNVNNGGNNSQDVNGDLSYTEQWASQLPVWQMEQQHSVNDQHFRPSTLPIAQQQMCQIAANIGQDNGATVSMATIMPLPSNAQQIIVNTSPDSHRRFVPMGASTPLHLPLAASNNAPAPTAWVTPLSHHQQAQQQHGGARDYHHGQFNNSQSRTAVVSPLPSQAPSINGTETLDVMSASFSGMLPNKSSSFDDSGIHKRRYTATDPKDAQELEEKQLKVQETKMAIEEQIADKKRQQLLEAEKERLELERLERERRLLELRESRENEHELNKWKELMEEEQRREGAILGALEKAKVEAKMTRKARLHQHAWSGRRSDSEELDSPPYAQQPTALNGGAALTIVSVNSGSSGSSQLQQHHQQHQQQEYQQHQHQPQEFQLPLQQQQQRVSNGRITPPSLVGSSLETSRSQSLPPLQHYIQSTPILDERPIKPLTVDPLKLWEQITGKDTDPVGTEPSRVPRRDAPARQSLRKSRSSEASKLLATKRSESLERKKSVLQATTSPHNNPSNNNVNNPVILKNSTIKDSSAVHKAKDVVDQRPAQPESRLASAATYIVKRDTFAPTVPSNNIVTINGVLSLPVSEDKPPVPARRDKERKKSKSKEPTPKDTDNSDNQDRNKLLQRRSSADPSILSAKPVETSSESENPWGDQLGGLNPLLQPIATRSRRKGRLSSGGASVPDSPISPSTTTVANNVVSPKSVSPKDINDSMIDLAISNGTDKGKMEKSKTDELISNSPNKTSILRSPSMDRFNFRSPLYSSFSVKIKQPNERQSDVLRQLSKLKEQLKKSQKDVEDKIRLKSPFLVNGKTQ